MGTLALARGRSKLRVDMTLGEVKIFNNFNNNNDASLQGDFSKDDMHG